MNENATNDEELMKVMGLNAGMVEGYSQVSLEPVGFRYEENWGWADTWCARHRAYSHRMGEWIVVDGRRVVVQKGRPKSKKELLLKWREMQSEAEAAARCWKYEQENERYS